MKEYKIVKKGLFTKLSVFEDKLNQLAREGWEVKAATGNGHDSIANVILEREKYK